MIACADHAGHVVGLPKRTAENLSISKLLIGDKDPNRLRTETFLMLDVDVVQLLSLVARQEMDREAKCRKRSGFWVATQLDEGTPGTVTRRIDRVVRKVGQEVECARKREAAALILARQATG